MNKPKLSINGQIHKISEEDLFQPLSQTLRRSLELTGTKVVCAEGDCGACTVIVKESGRTYTINSCIAPTFNLLDAEILTVEGLESRGQLHSVQQALCETQGTQCGYCTPGIVCSLAWSAERLTDQQKPFTKKRVQNALTGNLCRCTGYESIVEAGLSINALSDAEKRLPWAQSAISKTPPSAPSLEALQKTSKIFKSEGREHFMPVSWDEALEYKLKYKETRIISGATDLGVLTNKGKLALTRTMSLRNIKDARSLFKLEDSGEVKVGATVSLAELEEWLESKSLHNEFVELLRVFASPQIKNAGSLVGNLMNGSPIGDTLPFLFAMNARLEVRSATANREVKISELFTGYKTFSLDPEEVVTAIQFSLTPPANLKLYKVSLREDLDISAVTLAAYGDFKGESIIRCSLIFGGLSASVQHAPHLEKVVLNSSVSNINENDLLTAFDQDFKPFSDVRGSAEYRKRVSVNLLRKYLREIQNLNQRTQVAL